MGHREHTTPLRQIWLVAHPQHLTPRHECTNAPPFPPTQASVHTPSSSHEGPRRRAPAGRPAGLGLPRARRGPLVAGPRPPRGEGRSWRWMDRTGHATLCFGTIGLAYPPVLPVLPHPRQTPHTTMPAACRRSYYFSRPARSSTRRSTWRAPRSSTPWSSRPAVRPCTAAAGERVRL